MIDRYYIDFAKTFGGAMLLGVEQKMTKVNKGDLQSPMAQAHDKDGVPKWTVTLAVQTKSFENTKFENLAITVTSPNKPFGNIPLGTPCTVDNLILGHMPKEKGGGFSVFYSLESAESIRPLQPPRMASPQPQPVRVAGQ